MMSSLLGQPSMPPPQPSVASTVSGAAEAYSWESNAAEVSSGAVDSGRVPIGQAKAKAVERKARTGGTRYSTKLWCCHALLGNDASLPICVPLGSGGSSSAAASAAMVALSRCPLAGAMCRCLQ